MTTRAERALGILEGAGGRFVGVRFIKRTNGETRDMNCRAGVTKYKRGGELAFNPIERGLYPVYDLDKSEYRFVNLDGIQQIRVDGATYTFDENGEITVTGEIPENAHVLLGTRNTAVYAYDEEVGF